MRIHTLTLTLLISSLPVCMFGQSSTNSPYSMYGLGILGEQAGGQSRGMNGVGIAMRDGKHVNPLNPASYSAVDSLTFIFDAGLSLQTTTFKENGQSKRANSADFEYALASFRAMRHVGIAIGLVPYSNIGYSFTGTESVPNFEAYPYQDQTLTRTTTYNGSGGLHELFLGAAWQPLAGFSIGANVSYLWGDLTRSTNTTFTDAYVRTTMRSYEATVNTVRLRFGASYTLPLDKKRNLTLGLTFAPGLNLGCDATCRNIAVNAGAAVSDTTTYTASDAYEIPAELGIGLAYRHTTRLILALDYTHQAWASAAYPVYTPQAGGAYTVRTDQYSSRDKINAGAEYCHNTAGRSFFDRLRIRAGIGYTTPYIKVAGADGPREWSATLGFGIPIVNAYNNRSTLNVSAKWCNLKATNMLTENTFLFTVGLTFNERWFAKWKFE